MDSQSGCSSLCYTKIKSCKRRSFSRRICSSFAGITGRNQIFQSNDAGKSSSMGLKWVNNEFAALRLNSAAGMYASVSDLGKKLVAGSDFESVTASGNNGLEPFRGKPGSISFSGLTHQIVEEGKLESSPFEPRTGSFLWVAGSLVLTLSVILPPFVVGNLAYMMIKDMILAEIVASLSSEAIFYVGLAIFLIITDRVQRPYLEFSAKRWGLITGLRGYLTSAFFTTALKVGVPLFAVFVYWPEIGLESLVAVSPFLVSCLTQFVFGISLWVRGSSCWPIVPIIFEVYRIYQLNKAASFIDRLMFSMPDPSSSPKLIDRADALLGMLFVFQFLGVVCVWSLITFLLRLFPSRPVAHNY